MFLAYATLDGEMSLFSDILSSIGADVESKTTPPNKRPANPNASKTSDDLSKPVARLGINGTSTASNGLKRKAEDNRGKQQDRTSKPSAMTTSAKPAYAGTMSKALNPGQIPQRPRSTEGKPDSKTTSKPVTPAAASTAVNAPSKGSFAEIIARARAAQEERGQNQVGVIKHQKEQREKVSYLAQRKAGKAETKAKADKLDKLKNRPGHGGVLNGRIEKRARSNSPMKRPGSSSKMEKPARDRAPRPAYNGTMRMQPSKPREKPHQARQQDDYLGTDEEDNSDLADEVEEDDYGSEASSEDMEAGAFDIDEEEAAAARAARMEDAKEAALEKKLKAEKEERRKKLEALSKKAPPKRY